MLICSDCGTENQVNSKFCQNCGCALEVQSNIVKIQKTGSGVSKFTPLSREERFRKAKLAALKAIKDNESAENTQKSRVVFVGEKIL
ncbi:MAG: zinc-ribbon domain-containing protein [Candidatus Margulisbacteria bacterium]|jgi:uncharacterized membrane protein YvbJ|nr:zinc-ribbon domain-containing protein [Candidatus Margulisiibacteriota bacterium]